MNTRHVQALVLARQFNNQLPAGGLLWLSRSVGLSPAYLYRAPLPNLKTTLQCTTTSCRVMAVLSTAPLQFIASTPPVTRGFTAATVILSLVYYVLCWKGQENVSAPYYVLVPGSAIFYPWTFVTSAFVETTILEVSALLYSADRYVDIHGS